MTSSDDRHKLPMRGGFALVVTLSLMILLTLIAVGLLSLSAVSLRDSSQGMAQAEAKANARLALQIAIGELQKQMGPDQRISANGAILDTLKPDGSVQKSANNPHWTGVWDSWIAGPVDPTTVNPSYPEKTDPTAQSAHSTIEPNGGFPANLKPGVIAPKYPPNPNDPDEKGRRDYFRSWLVSLLPADADKAASAKDLVLEGKQFPGESDTAIRLVGSVSSSSTDFVSARLIDATSPKGGKGRYGWWVGDENQKARLMRDAYQGATLSSAEKIYRRQAPGSTGTKVAAGLGTIDNDSEVSRLATLGSLDLLTGATNKPYHKNFHAATVHSRSVLADVREGGLKRDLSAILERPISTSDTGSEFMLYEFDDPRFPGNRSNSRVPIQDLAAYYQLYDNDANWSRNKRGGVTYDSTALPNTIQVTTPNYDGGNKNRLTFQGEYSGLYKQPAIAKVQFLLAMGAQQVTSAERATILALAQARDANNAQRANEIAAGMNPPPTTFNGSLIQPMRDTDTHKLLLGIMPVITLWNPNNIPMVMDNSQILRFCTPPFALRWRKYRNAGTIKDFRYYNLNYAMGGSSVTSGIAEWGRPYIVSYRFARNAPIVFEPGEVKMFSAPSTAGGTLKAVADVAQFRDLMIDPVNTWDPNGLFLVPRSTPQGGWGGEAPDAYNFNFAGGYDNRENMVFERDDRITLEIVVEQSTGGFDGRRTSYVSEVLGAGFNLSMADEGFYNGNTSSWGNYRLDFMRNFQMLSRHGGVWVHGAILSPIDVEQMAFNQQLFTPAFPSGTGIINFKNQTNALICGNIIDASAAGDAIGLMDFSLSYGCEVGLAGQGGYSSGRKIASRPFLHSGLNAAPSIDQADKASLYNYGWDWQLNPINNIEDSIIQGESATGRGFFGGGYTVESGTTHVVQREIPVLPPISIASLSHAHLGGFSLARNNTIGQNPAADDYAISIWTGNSTNRVRAPEGVDYQQITATGQGGLAPHVVQAIGNSYAHPNIAADKAFAFKPRQLDGQEPSVNAPFVDHSYLANKALWDDCFFSSITPQPDSVKLYGRTTRTAQEVATDFFKNGAQIPNRRLMAYKSNLDGGKLDDLLAGYSSYRDGFADRVASHLMVEGGFNINSTSVEAWKILFSSLKGKPSVYLASGVTPSESSPSGTVVGFGSLPAAGAIATGDISGPNAPAEQWKGGRELSDDEIGKLAIAMVEQVKLRGPFLSLSEFINRRLDGTNQEFALKGALQAALDHPAVPINAGFRNSGRILDNETASISFQFNAAAKGPIAYGSAAYVDQADVLRGLSEQLAPRGDTFIIRTYGDSIDKNGKVLARAWCEAVMQRVPDYLDPADEPHVKRSSLKSEPNRMFGRKLEIVSFRWLHKQEI